MHKLLQLLWRKKVLVILLVLICISRGFVILWLNSGYAKLIDSILSGKSGFILESAAILLSAGGVHIAVMFMQNLTASALSEKAGYQIRSEVIDGMLNNSYKAVENMGSGESLSRLNTDLAGITAWIRNEVSAWLSDIILFTIVLVAMLYTNWKLTVLSFCIVPFLSAGSYFLSKPITRAEKEKNEAVSDVNIIVKSIADAFPVFRIFQMKQPLSRRADDKINASIMAEMRANGVRSKLMSINGFASFLPNAIMWGVGGYMVMTGSSTAGALLAFTNMSNFVRGPLTNLPGRIDAGRTSAANMTRVFSMLSQLTDGKHSERGCSVSMMNENVIEFRNVSFGYSDSKANIKNVSFTVKKGSKTAIVGESGCGKSTVLKLIAGLYEADEGQILVFGEDISKSDLEEVRSGMSYVPQESQLFPVSIYENITCGHSMSVDDVMAACEAARLKDFIYTQPEGIYTNIGEHGNRISGGEKQRICIARAIAKNAPVFILDEATSALDGQTENQVLDFIDTLCGRHTVVFVTHKIKNAVNADMIICMKNGQICETGTHEDLLKADGYYAKLFKVQNMIEVLSE